VIKECLVSLHRHKPPSALPMLCNGALHLQSCKPQPCPACRHGRWRAALLGLAGRRAQLLRASTSYLCACGSASVRPRPSSKLWTPAGRAPSTTPSSAGFCRSCCRTWAAKRSATYSRECAVRRACARAALSHVHAAGAVCCMTWCNVRAWRTCICCGVCQACHTG